MIPKFDETIVDHNIGNVEYFLHLRAEAESPLHGEQLEQAVRRAVAEGPQ